MAKFSAATTIVVGVGTASALFVDYLAGRALARTSDGPLVISSAAADEIAISEETHVASIVPASSPPTSAPAVPPPAPIEAQLPDPEAIARVAVPGPDGVSGDSSVSAYLPEEPATPTPKPKKNTAAAQVAALPDSGSGRIIRAVNMRSAPKKGAGVLTVVPAGTSVKVMSCNSWCQISYEGREGWVYKSFLSLS